MSETISADRLAHELQVVQTWMGEEEEAFKGRRKVDGGVERSGMRREWSGTL